MLTLRYGAAASLFILIFILVPATIIFPLLDNLCPDVNIAVICGPNSITDNLLVNNLYEILGIFFATFAISSAMLVYMTLRMDFAKADLEKDRLWVKKYPQSQIFYLTLIIGISTAILMSLYYFVPDSTVLEYPLSSLSAVFISALFLLLSMWFSRKEAGMAERLGKIEDRWKEVSKTLEDISKTLEDISKTLKRIEDRLP